MTCYAKPARAANLEGLAGAMAAAYADAPFVRALPAGELPDAKRVTGANVCEVGVGRDPRTGTVVAMGAVDNLVKGAAGQAIQNMNLMLGLDETTGLSAVGVYP